MLSARTRRTIIAVLGIFMLCAQQVAASTANDFICAQQGDFGGTCFYDPDASSSCTGSTASFGPGTLPSYIKAPYNAIFTAAASKYNINPAALVALFYNEQYGFTNSVSTFKSHVMPTPPPPYGSGVPWSNDGGASAEGPFQFLPSTWLAEGVDGNGDGTKDANDLTDAAFGAANYLSDGDLGIKITASSSQSDIAIAATHYYGDHTLDAYGTAAGTIYALVIADEAGGGGGTPTTPGSTCAAPGSTGTSCTGATGNATILCEAKQYAGVYYGVGASHDYKSFEAQCPQSVLATAASTSTAADPGPCESDCSGLVSVAVDDAFGQNFAWDVAGIETDHTDWSKLSSISDAQPGDVVTVGTDTHVEIVDHYDSSSGIVYTFGSHAPGQTTSGVSSPSSYWTGGAYKYIGPTS
jgi:hypothetical protein